MTQSNCIAKIEDPHIAEYVLNSQLAQFSLSTVTAHLAALQGRLYLTLMKPEKTVDILRRYRWFPREMMFEKRAQKFHTDDASLPRFDWMRQISNQSPVWNFCARHRWRREMSGRLRKLINVDLVSFCFALFFFFFLFLLPITVTSADCPLQYCLTQLTLVSSNTKNDHLFSYAIYVTRLT